LVTYPPDPLPLAREGGVQVERGEAPLKISSPSPFKERGVKGVRSRNNLYGQPLINFGNFSD